MKKLTAGILTVMLGLVVADANAAITSKQYVDDKVSGAVTTINTTITNEVKDLNDAIDGVKDDVTSLQGTVDALTADEGEGSIAAQIADSLKDYAKTTDVESKIETATDDMETKTNAEATYATKTALEAEETARTNAISAMDTAYKAADAAIEAKIGTVAEGKTVSQMISEAQTAATYNDTEVRGLISDNADAIEAMDAAYKAADATLTTAVEKAQGDATQALNESIKEVKDTGVDGTYVLTIKTIGDVATLKWEAISRDLNAE